MTCSRGQTRILLGQLYANGDCLFATTVARQIKMDFPGCHLTWAISKSCRGVLRENPDVDAVWEVRPPPLRPRAADPGLDQSLRMWKQFKQDAFARQAAGDFDEVFLTQIGARTLHFYDGTIRSTIYRGYPRPITVPIAPVLRLAEEEIERVRTFVAAHPALSRCKHRVLFECSPKSNRMFVNPTYAQEVCKLVLTQEPDVCFVLSSNVPIESADERILDGSALSLRENAELTKYCTLLIGCSSGITWLCTSDWAEPLPTIQLLSSTVIYPNSIHRDHQQQHLPTEGILEMIDCPELQVSDCLVMVIRQGFAAAKSQHHQEISLAPSYDIILAYLLSKGLYRRSLYFLRNNLQREKYHARLVWGAARAFWKHALSRARFGAGAIIRLVYPHFRTRPTLDQHSAE
jgi:hypothetical protein